jgi:hypothetical protein
VSLLRNYRAEQELLAALAINDRLWAQAEDLRSRLRLAEGYLQQIADWQSADLNDLKNEARLALKALRK